MIPELLAQNAVLFAKVINDMQLPLVHPARHGQQNETERIEYFGHYVSSLSPLKHANELEGIQTVPISRPYAITLHLQSRSSGLESFPRAVRTVREPRDSVRHGACHPSVDFRNPFRPELCIQLHG